MVIASKKTVFWLGFCVAICIVVGIVFLGELIQLPKHFSYVEVSRWLSETESIQLKIEEIALKQSTLTGVGQQIPKALLRVPSANTVEVLANGEILIQGKETGQVLVLLPTLNGGKVSWRWIGGPPPAR